MRNDSGTPTTKSTSISQRGALLVDLESGFRRALATELASRGYRIDECDDARVALALALSRPPSVVVAASTLRGFDGIELCRALRRDRATKGTRTLLLVDEQGPLSTASGAVDAVLLRPVEPEVGCEHADRLVRTAEAMRPAPEKVPARSRRRASQMRARQTATPPSAPPPLHCTDCGQPLRYQHSYLAGANISRPDQWDRYVCIGGCGTFVWRRQGRKLQRVSAS